jgi:hypothetical protein
MSGSLTQINHDVPTSLSLRDRSVMIFVISMILVINQIAVTRILSVVVWYHMAFMAISLVMLGLGAPAIWMTKRLPTARNIQWMILIGAALCPASIIVIFKLGKLMPDWAIMISIAALLPLFVALGSAVCGILLTTPSKEFRRIYGIDLAGAAFGALLTVPLLHLIDTPHIVAGSGILLALACAVPQIPKMRRISAFLCLTIVLALIWNEPFRLNFTKSYDETKVNAKVIFEKWTPTARLIVFDKLFWTDQPQLGFVWGPGTSHQWNSTEQYWFEQDGNAGTSITKFDGDLSRLAHLLEDATAVGYRIRKPQRVAIVGTGGGRDLLTALSAGADAIDGIEINGGIIRAMRGPFKEFSGSLYDHPKINMYEAEGRSFLSRSDRSYSHIQISLVDSWAATAAGAFTLSENNLYTVEAIKEFVARLQGSGLLMISRWKDREIPRLTATAHIALKELGMDEPRRHIMVVTGGSVGTLLVSREPFSEPEWQELSTLAATRGFTVTRLQPGELPIDLLTTAIASGFSRGTGITEMDLRPAIDDRPFFFQFSSFSRIQWNDPPILRLQISILVVAILTVFLFFFPLRNSSSQSTGSIQLTQMIYVAAIGIGFMLIELPVIQKFILFLGHPSYATTVVLSSLLLGTGFGSFFLVRRLARSTMIACLVATISLSSLCDWLFSLSFSWDLSYRIVLSFCILLPLGACMGVWLPTVMSHSKSALKPWLWAINGASGVLASLCSIALAINYGFTAVIWTGFGCYLVAFICYLRSREFADDALQQI